MTNNTFKVRDSRKKRFFYCDNEILYYGEILTPIGIAIYISLCRHADINEEAFPSQITIAKEIGIKDRETCSKYIRILEEYNIISIGQTKDEVTGKWLHNTYSLMDKSVWIQPTVSDETRHGNHVRLNPTRVEADTVSDETDTKNTHIIKNTNIENVHPIVFNEDKTGNPYIKKRRAEIHANKVAYGSNSFNKPKVEPVIDSSQLIPLTPLEIWKITSDLFVDIRDVMDKHKEVLETISFGNKYKITNVEMAVRQWMRKAIADGQIDKLPDDIGRTIINDWHPDEIAKSRAVVEALKEKGIL